jgi:hypothetical protein
LVGVAGLGLAVKGQSDQKKANAAALAQNQSSQDTQNQVGWSNYLMTRGIAPTGPVTPGQLPGPGQFKAVNSRLPLWMTLPGNVAKPSGATAAPPAKRRIIGYARA